MNLKFHLFKQEKRRIFFPNNPLISYLFGESYLVPRCRRLTLGSRTSYLAADDSWQEAYKKICKWKPYTGRFNLPGVRAYRLILFSFCRRVPARLKSYIHKWFYKRIKSVANGSTVCVMLFPPSSDCRNLFAKKARIWSSTNHLRLFILAKLL